MLYRACDEFKLKSKLLSEEKDNVVCNLGINPWQTVDEIGLQMNKPDIRLWMLIFRRFPHMVEE